MKLEEKYEERLAALGIDCKRCSGLCCVALYYAKIDGFPKDKEAGVPCGYLQPDFGCQIHDQLKKKQMKGCLGYECIGVGQWVTSIYAKDGNWRSHPDMAEEMFDTFLHSYELRQMLWYLIQAAAIPPKLMQIDPKLHKEITKLIEENDNLTKRRNPKDLSAFDLEEYRSRVNASLKSITKHMAKGTKEEAKVLFGKNFKGKSLNYKDYSMALLIGADFTGCSLRGTNFLGADMRDCIVRDTDLRECLFLTQMQVNSMRGNQGTRLPKYLVRPLRWM